LAASWKRGEQPDEQEVLKFLEKAPLNSIVELLSPAQKGLSPTKVPKVPQEFLCCYSTPRLVNYLYLSQKLSEIDDPVKREEFLKALTHGFGGRLGHLNLLGEYDFSEDKLKDSVGIKPPKLTG
jgi:hypothetical protein